MKKLRNVTIGMLALAFLHSCKKDNTPPPSFSAEGYWQGSFFSGYILSVLNRPDGTSRLFYLTGSLDTANPARGSVVLNGVYAVKGDEFEANYIDTTGASFINLVSSHTTLNSMNGVLFLNGTDPNQNPTLSFTYELIRR